jgi:hypothetical protein
MGNFNNIMFYKEIWNYIKSHIQFKDAYYEEVHYVMITEKHFKY